jgi:2-oxoglutarate dehydrogenase E2 component (dihydrolipoamide succinyltransferase)
MAEIQMPQLGETVTEGTITKWFKQVGDQVAEDEPLFEVSTDKVDSEVPSPVSGELTEILVAEGDTVDVGAVLARIGDGGGAAAPAPADGGAEAEAPAEEAFAEEAPADEPAPAAETEAAPAQSDSPAEVAPATAAATESSPGDAPAEAPKGRSNGKLLSPVVRRLISENDLDPTQIEGTGPGGRITRGDVLSVIDSGAAAAKAAPAQAPAAPAAQPAAAQAQAPASAPAARTAPQVYAKAGESDTAVPHTNIRRRTAEHMTRSKQTSAHVYAAIEVDFEKVDQVRKAHKDAFKASEGFSLTYLPFISRALIDAIAEYPEVNASFGENELVVHNYVNLGIAVDLDFKGLMVPVVHDAEGKRLRAVAREISGLAARARSKQLGPDDIAGGTFTITNPGPFGTTLTLPIINQPQVAIVSTDGIKRRPVVVDLPDGSEAIAIHSVGNLTLTWDHRAFDGAYAASFLHRTKEIIETRGWEAELA